MRSANSSMPNVVEQLVDASQQLRVRDALHLPLQLEVLAPGRVDVDAGALRHVADRSPHGNRLAGDVVPRDGRPPRVLLGQGDEDLDRRRLAGAVRPEKPEDLALLDAERHAVERANALRVRLLELLDLDRRHRGQCRGRISSGPPAQPAHVGAGSHPARSVPGTAATLAACASA